MTARFTNRILLYFFVANIYIYDIVNTADNRNIRSGPAVENGAPRDYANEALKYIYLYAYFMILHRVLTKTRIIHKNVHHICW